MLVDYLKEQRRYQPVPKQTTSIKKGFCVPIVLCCCVVTIIIIVVPIALIPVYIKHNNDNNNNQVTTNDNDTIGIDQQLLFKLPATNDSTNFSSSENGRLNSDGLKQLETIMQSTMDASSNQAIATSRIIVKNATFVDSTDSVRKKRDVLSTTLNETASQRLSTRNKLLNVSCTLYVKPTYSSYSPSTFNNLLQTNVVAVVQNIIPPTILAMVEKQCSDNTGYFEPTTGHTCQTYIDYGFCNGTQVLIGSAINQQLAQENCCSCGKQA